MNNIRIFYEGETIDIVSQGLFITNSNFAYDNNGRNPEALDYTFFGNTDLNLKGVKFPEGDTEVGEVVVHGYFPRGTSPSYPVQLDFSFYALWI